MKTSDMMVMKFWGNYAQVIFPKDLSKNSFRYKETKKAFLAGMHTVFEVFDSAAIDVSSEDDARKIYKILGILRLELKEILASPEPEKTRKRAPFEGYFDPANLGPPPQLRCSTCGHMGEPLPDGVCPNSSCESHKLNSAIVGKSSVP